MLTSQKQYKLLALLTLGYFILLVYASLMPYDFRTDIDIKWHINKALHAWPVNPYARVSGSDILSNLILYIPLGALLATYISVKKHARWKTFGATLLICIATSFSIETVQMFSTLRTASITDLLMNSISGAIGAAAGALYGLAVWKRINISLELRLQSNPIDILTLLFAGLLAADALSPYRPTLLLSQVWRSIKASHFDPIVGFAQHPWHWWLITHVMIYMVFTLMVSQWRVRENSKAGILHAGMFCGLFAITIECGKIFIASRVINTANIIANLSGILLAAILLHLWRKPVSSTKRLVLGTIVLSIYILYIGWTPFNFAYSAEVFAAKLPHGVEFLPFYHYAMGASLNHVRLFIQTIIFSAALIYFVRILLKHTGYNRRHIVVALLISGGIGLLQEGGQLFLPSRTPSMSDVYCYMLGGVLATRIPLVYTQGEDRKAKHEI